MSAWRKLITYFLIETRSLPALARYCLVALPSMSLLPVAPFLVLNFYFIANHTVLELGSVPLPAVTARIDRFITEGDRGPYPDME
jgi:hypothetical protein